MSLQKECPTYTVWYVERPPHLEKLLELIQEKFPEVPFSEIEIIPGYLNFEIRCKSKVL